MGKFIRLIDKHVENLIILDVEALCYFSHKLQYHAPYAVCDGNLLAAGDSILEETAYGLVVGEPPCRRADYTAWR